MSDEVPEADALEQRIAASPAAPADPADGRPRPVEASEADYLEQRRPVLSGAEGPLPGPDPEAPEADLLEQGTALPVDDDEEYPPLTGSAGEGG